MYNLVNVRMSLLEGRKCEEIQSGNNSSSKINNNVLELVGNTPLIRLNKIPQENGVCCEIYAKCEFMNPGGSVKDRIALSMVEDAKKAGEVTNKTHLVEPTSGNTGIGLAMSAAILGNKCTIITGAKASTEKVSTMRLLGAEVIEAKEDEIEEAKQMKNENPDTIVMLNQFDNLVNPMTHFESTGSEILSALDKIDMIVMGAGTGGTMSGVGLRLKQKYPNCVVVAAEPEGSTLLNPKGKEHPFLVEGVGGTWAPIVLDKSVVDHVEVVSDKESFLMARDLARKEGLLCGGSSGTAVVAAIKAAKSKQLGAGKRIVVILPDGIRNYMTKFVSDQWMEAHLFMDPPKHTMKWWNKPITDLKFTQNYPLLKKNVTCIQALNAMNDANIAVITDENGYLVGAISKDSLRNAATNPRKESEEISFKDLAVKHLVKDCYTLAENGKKGMPTIGLLSRILDITPFVIIGREVRGVIDHFEPKGVVTGDNVLDYIYQTGDSTCSCPV